MRKIILYTLGLGIVIVICQLHTTIVIVIVCFSYLSNTLVKSNHQITYVEKYFILLKKDFSDLNGCPPLFTLCNCIIRIVTALNTFIQLYFSIAFHAAIVIAIAIYISELYEFILNKNVDGHTIHADLFYNS